MCMQGQYSTTSLHNQSENFDLHIFFFFNGLAIYLVQAWNLLCSADWHWTCGESPASGMHCHTWLENFSLYLINHHVISQNFTLDYGLSWYFRIVFYCSLNKMIAETSSLLSPFLPHSHPQLQWTFVAPNQVQVSGFIFALTYLAVTNQTKPWVVREYK